MKVIVAVTGASGAIYARQVLETLLKDKSVERIALIHSRHAPDVIEAEGVTLPTDPRIEVFDNDDISENYHWFENDRWNMKNI